MAERDREYAFNRDRPRSFRLRTVESHGNYVSEVKYAGFVKHERFKTDSLYRRLIRTTLTRY